MAPANHAIRIIKRLQEFGVNEREAAIYLHCLSAGPQSVQEISKTLEYNRITVHSAVEQLLSKGLVAETRKGKRRQIVAEPPSIFGRLLQQRENELRVLQGHLGDLTELLSFVPRKMEAVPSVRFLEGVDGFRRMLEETLTARDEVLVFTYVDLFSKLLGAKYLEDYFARRSAKGIRTRLIFPPCPFAERVGKRAEEYKIKIRLLPPEFKWKAGIFSWNNCLSLKSFTHGQITCTIVENEDLSYFYRNVLFELAWRQARIFTEPRD